MTAPRTPPPSDEHRHPPDPDPEWQEGWDFDFVAADGSLGGYVRLGLWPARGVSWYWACLVGDGRPLVTVLEPDAPLPAGQGLEVRAEGLWCDHICETPLDHWTLGLEAFAVALESPTDAYGACLGDLVPLGLDLEWETAGAVVGGATADRYHVTCEVHGDVLVGSETIDVSGHGSRAHEWGPARWWTSPWCRVSGRLDDGTTFAGLVGGDGHVQPGGGEPTGSRFEGAAADLPADGVPPPVRVSVAGVGIAVEPRHLAPVAPRAPDGRTSHLARALCRCTADDGRAGWGWGEWNRPDQSPAPVPPTPAA